MKKEPPLQNLTALLPALGQWYESHQRSLPWRSAHSSPYDIWISEVMSQQSTLKTVIPYFENWKKKFPTLEALAQASEEEVLQAWAGLGYYSRARNIKKAAEALQSFLQKTGKWPEKAETWIQFPGIGPYTSRAICSIAFGQKVLPVDGNVIRVLSRFWNIPNPLNDPSHLKEIIALSEKVMTELPPHLRAGSVTQAFMELGALVCRPAEQACCLLCPLKTRCQAFKSGTVAETPRTKQRAQIEEKIQLALAYRNQKGELLLRRIPAGRHLSGQHELPLWVLENAAETPEFINKIKKTFEVRGPVSHSITRYRFRTYLVMAEDWGEESLPQEHYFWNPRSQNSELHPTTLTRKLVNLLNF